MNETSAPLPHGEDEFTRAKLDAALALGETAARRLSPVAFECKVTQHVPLTNVKGEPANSWLTLGEVVCIHIDKRLIKDGVYDTVAAHPIARGGGPADYFAVEESVRFRDDKTDGLTLSSASFTRTVDRARLSHTAREIGGPPPAPSSVAKANRRAESENNNTSGDEQWISTRTRPPCGRSAHGFCLCYSGSISLPM